MPKKLASKIIKNITYELVLFEGDNRYVIYKMDINKNSVVKIPEVAKFDNEKEAREFFDKIK